MGVNLRDLFEPRPVPEGWLDGKRIAVDGHNVAFRYLTSYRGRDGDVLRSPDGRAIGHLVGYVNLVRHLRERGAEPIVVWDGATHPRKRATVEQRITARVEAALDAEAALAAGDQAAYLKHLRASTYLDAGMVRDATRLLESLGVAVVRAPHDGERYAAALCQAGHADAVATEDFDALVAGAPVVVRKAGSPDSFLQQLSDLEAHGLTREQLRHIAILCGTDFHPGVKGFGAKTAAKMLREQADLRALLATAERGVAGDGGEGGSRYLRLLAEARSAGAGLSVAEFEELDAFLAELPPVAAPRPSRPDPAAAAGLAGELGMQRQRIMACFC